MKLLLPLIFALPLLSNVIEPNFYQLEAPCDGYTLGDYEHGGCITGEIRYFSPQGTVLTRMLEWTAIINQESPECSDCDQPPIDTPPILPPVSVVPEPQYFGLIAILGLLAHRRMAGGGVNLKENV